MILLDDSELLVAAEALEREAVVLDAHALGDRSDAAEAAGVLRETAARLRQVSREALAAHDHNDRGWPVVRVAVQGVSVGRDRVEYVALRCPGCARVTRFPATSPSLAPEAEHERASLASARGKL